MKIGFYILMNYLLISCVISKLKDNIKRENSYKSNLYSVYSINTNIILPERSYDCIIKEKVMFQVSQGIYSNFTRKIYSDAPNIISTISKSKYCDNYKGNLI